MSHAPERKEKDCLNCGTVIHGRFCHVCGQENVVPKENFWHLIIHFFYDITHFDSKFFDTLRYLLFRPGFLSKEYIAGRRASYLNPIRMYVFTSAIFFLVFFSMRSDNFVNVTGNEPYTQAEKDSIIRVIERKMKDSSTTNLQTQLSILSDTSRVVLPAELLLYSDDNDFVTMSTWGGDYKNMREYDSIQHAMPSNKRDGWIKRLWNKRAIKLNEKYKKDKIASIQKISSVILHNLPYLLFISLPFFALILKLLYIRRKKFYYADHGIFTVHHYILSFILLLFVLLLDRANDMYHLGILSILMTVTIIAWPVYLYLAMKRFYGQGKMKTFFKFLLLNLSGLIVMAILFAVFFLFSIFQI